MSALIQHTVQTSLPPEAVNTPDEYYLRGLVCLNADRHGLLCHCRHQSLHVVSGHVLVTGGTLLSDAHGST